MHGWNRLQPLPNDAWSEETRGLLTASIERVGGMVDPPPGEPPRTLNILRQVAHHAKLLGPFLDFETALALEGSISRRDHELIALRTIWHARSDFEWGHHVGFARKAGIKDEEIARIPAGPGDPAWSEGDRLLLEATDELCTSTAISDATWERLRARLGDAELVELPFLVGNYTMLSMVANATGVPLEQGFPPLPGTERGRID